MTEKVLHIINGEHFAGAERVQDLLALNLPYFGYECEFICLKEGEFNKRRKSTCPTTVFTMNSKFDLSISKRVVEAVKDKNFKIIHTHSPRSALIGKKVARVLDLPWIHHIHSPSARETENFFRNLLNAFIEDHLILSKADRLVPVSLSLKDYLIEHGVKPSKITPVLNGVPIVKHETTWQAPQDGIWVIGTVALFRPRKGLEVLLNSIKQIANQGYKVQLKAVGTFETSEYEKEIKSLATQLKISHLIDWAGFSDNIHIEMESMHIFVLPSLFGEGLPMVVIEAMSVGIPVVSTAVEGIPDVLQNGGAGIIVKPNNINDLKEGILQFLNGKQAPLNTAKIAMERQHSFYSDRVMTKGISEIYNRFLQH